MGLGFAIDNDISPACSWPFDSDHCFKWEKITRKSATNLKQWASCQLMFADAFD